MAASTKKAKQKKLPVRSKVKTADTWDLASLYADEAAWETAFAKWEKQTKRYAKFRGTLGQSAAQLAACLKFDLQYDRRWRTARHLRFSQDGGRYG